MTDISPLAEAVSDVAREQQQTRDAFVTEMERLTEVLLDIGAVLELISATLIGPRPRPVEQCTCHPCRVATMTTDSDRAGLLFECGRCGAAPGYNCRTYRGRTRPNGQRATYQHADRYWQVREVLLTQITELQEVIR